MDDANGSVADTDDSGAVSLGAGEVACGDCGVAVPESETRVMASAVMVRGGRTSQVPFSARHNCEERDRSAVDLAERYLRQGVTVGDRRYALGDARRLLVETRAAYDASGASPIAIDAAAVPSAALASEITNLQAAISRLRWRDRLSPPQSIIAEPIRLVRPGTANARPWAHLEEADREKLRARVGKVLAERLSLGAPSVELPPPESGPNGVQVHDAPAAAGCLYCGVGVVSLSAFAVVRRGGAEAAAASTWTFRRIDPAAIGAGRSTTERLSGWLCRPCNQAASGAGTASSARAVEHALSAFLGVKRLTLAGRETWVSGLKGWGAYVAEARQRGNPDPNANDRPWAHLSSADLEQLVADWRRGGSAEQSGGRLNVNRW